MRKLGVLGITLLGIWVLAESAWFLAFPISAFSGRGWESWQEFARVAILACAPFVAAVVFGSALIAYRHQLSARLFDDAPVETSVDSDDLLRIGLALIGMATAIAGVTGLLDWLAEGATRVAQARVFVDGGFRPGEIAMLVLPGFASPAVELWLGLWLVSRAKTLSLRQWRQDAHSPEEPGHADSEV